jgi:hypothetical protein
LFAAARVRLAAFAQKKTRAFLQTCLITPVLCGAGAPESFHVPQACALEVFLIRALETRARGTPDASCVRSLVRNKNKHTSKSPRMPNIVRRSARSGLNGSLRENPR